MLSTFRESTINNIEINDINRPLKHDHYDAKLSQRNERFVCENTINKYKYLPINVCSHRNYSVRTNQSRKIAANYDHGR